MMRPCKNCGAVKSKDGHPIGLESGDWVNENTANEYPLCQECVTKYLNEGKIFRCDACGGLVDANLVQDNKCPICNKAFFIEENLELLNARAEFVGSIIDVFEDFLDKRHVTIPNDEHEGEEGEAILYGSDYDELQEQIENILYWWGIAPTTMKSAEGDSGL